MASTIWVSSAARGDNNGTTYEHAYGSILSGLNGIAADGDTVNIVADGTHTNNVSSHVLITDDNVTVQGVGIGGLPAMATITMSSAARQFVSLRGTAQTFLGQNLIFDSTASPTDAVTHMAFAFRSNTQGGHTIRYCAMLGGLTGVMPAANRYLATTDSIPSASDQGTMQYCYVQNVRTANEDTPGLGQKFAVDHCIFLNDANAVRVTSWLGYGALAGSDAAHKVSTTSCTFYDDAGAGDIVGIIRFDPAAAAADVGEVTCHSNVVWVESSGTVNPFMSGSTDTSSVTKTGTIGPNVLVGGPSVTSGSLSAFGWYEEPWDANEDNTTDPDTWPLDSVVYGEAAATMFNDPTTTYAWVLPNDLTITILKDLRLIKHQTSGLFGALPGALPSLSDGGTGGGDPEDNEDPVNNPFLDVRPIYATEMKLELNMGLRLSRNEIVQAQVVRSDTENRRFREFKTERVVLAANTTTTFRSGIENGDFLYVEATEEVQVSVGSTADVFYPAATKLVLSDGDFSVVQIKNASATTAATVLITEVD